MKLDTASPCSSCPYRKEAKLEYWHREEYENLLQHDSDPMMGAVFACHGTRKLSEQSICAGWFLDQRSRGLPSIQLRLLLLKKDPDGVYLDSVTGCDGELYRSIEEMVRANYPDLLDQG